jgi:dihydrofolate reductase
MKKILVFVSTLDGKVTKWGDPNVKAWSSKNDQEYFKKLWNDTRIIIMGSSTYNAESVKPSPNHLLVIMTRNPLQYTSIETSDQLEFTDKSPAQLVERFEKEGHNQILIVGGPHVATSFLKERLIDELWLTIEPKIFGMGSNFVIEEKLDINLQLISLEKVNDRGTLITKYAVL